MDNSKPSKAPVNPIAKTTSTANRANLIAIIAIIISVIAVVAAFFLWQHATSRSGNINQQLAALQKSVQKNELQSQTNLQFMQTQVQNQQKALMGVQTTVENALKSTYDQQKERALSQASYLLNLANLHLALGHDAKTGLILLQMANKRIASLNDPSLFTLKHALQHDIDAVKKAQTVNVSQLIIDLDNLNTSIQKLRFKPRKFSASKQNDQQQQQAKPKHWYNKLLHDLSGLKDLVVIRRSNQPTMPLLTPEAEWLTKAYLQFKVAQVQWSVIHQQPKLYLQSLQSISSWLNKYFKDVPGTAELTKQIAKLEKINIKPKMPNISGSLSAMNNIMSNLFNTPASTTPSNTNNTQHKVNTAPSKTNNDTTKKSDSQAELGINQTQRIDFRLRQSNANPGVLI